MNDRPLPADDAHPDDDQPRDPAEERDACLTAHALGELGPAERDTVERLLADPAAAAARSTVLETRAIAEALRAARRLDATAPSPDLRRAVVAALARASDDVTGLEPSDASPAPARRGRLGWLSLSGALAASLLVGFIVTRHSPPAGPGVETVSPTSSTLTDAPPNAPVPPARVASRDRVTPEPAEMAKRFGTPPPAGEPSQRSGDAPAPAATAAGIAGAPRMATEELAAAASRGLDEKAAQDASPARREAAVAGKAAGPRGPAANGAPLGDVARSMPVASERQLGRQVSEGLQDADRLARSAPAAAGRLDQRAEERKELERLGVADREESRLGTHAASNERYATFLENRFKSAADAPLSTFSIDVDTASYALVRRFLSSGQRPPPDAVRLEELLNYFSYDDPAPAGDDPFSVTVEAAACPWRPGHRLVRIGLRGRDVPRAERPAGNLVFLVDVSGSMRDDDKLPLVKQGLGMLVEELTEDDRVAIVTYAGDAGLRLPSTSGADKGAILAAIESLASGGSTHGSAGIELAYAQAAAHFVPGGVNRVILATDGDLNVGITDDRALVDLISAKAAGGTFLTVLGVGRGNLQDEKLEKLAAHGNGIYAYLDGAREARKVLVEQLTGSTITIAKDVKIQVEFNPAVVGSWRQLGYENRLMAARDFRDDTKDAGDIGAGHAVTALYEVEIVGEADDPSGGEPLKYRPRGAAATAAPAPPASTELLTVKLRFKRPDGATSVLREVPLAARGGAFVEASADLRFAASVAAFGMLLRGSEFVGDATYDWVATTAAKSLGTDAGGWRTEFLDLVRRAAALAGPPAATPVPLPR